MYNSPLSEYAALGFEYGYSVAAPDALVLWEAQFGDFVNGAQIVIDQFIVAGRSKWKQTSRLTLLLPHGYEGNGPEHSSARLERFLQLGAQENIRVANCTTAAQYFHLLRRQALDAVARPLVLMTPKGLLRLKQASSSLAELRDGRFQPVLDDPGADHDAVERLVLCSGKLYFDVVGHELRESAQNVAVARIEQLYPFPVEALEALLGVVSAAPRGRLGAGGAAEHGAVALDPASSRGERPREHRRGRPRTSAGRGKRARARATRPRTTASRTGSSGRRSASPTSSRPSDGAGARAATAAAATRGPCVRATARTACRCAGGRRRHSRKAAQTERERARRGGHAAIQAHARRAGRRPARGLHCGVARDGSDTRIDESMPTETRIPENPFTEDAAAAESASSLSNAIQEHLDLKQRNAGLDSSMPLDRYSIEDPFENHPLFKSEEQARLEETLENVPPRSSRSPRPAGRARTTRSPRGRRSTRVSGVARATSTGASDAGDRRASRAADRLARMTPEERLERYADLVVRVGANVQEGQEVVLFHQVEHVPIARAVARAAYQAGARRVHPQPADLHIRKAAIEFGPEEELGDDAAALPRLGEDLARDEARDHPAHRQPGSRPVRRARRDARRRRPSRGTCASSTCRSSSSGLSTG